MPEQSPISSGRLLSIRRPITSWGRENFAPYPWRFIANHWHALAAEVMLQRTRADQVQPVYLDFCLRYPTPADYLADNNALIFSRLGLSWREKSFRELAKALVQHGDIPIETNELLNLPGVGSYIAAAYRSMHLGIQDTIIDSNIVRLYGRYFGFETDGETRRKRWFIDLAERITPARRCREFNYALLDFTRAVCKTSPECKVCALRKKCAFNTQHTMKGTADASSVQLSFFPYSFQM